MSTTWKFLAAVLATSVCLATSVAAHGSEARGASSARSYCADLQREISAQGFRFSGWRCKPGPNVRGRETILAWVKLSRFGGKAHLELIWLAKTRPVLEAQVIDAANVPRYGYEPSDVRQAARIADVQPLSV